MLSTPMMQSPSRFNVDIDFPSAKPTKEPKEHKELQVPDDKRDLKKSMVKGPRTPWRKTLPGLLAQVALFQTSAGPIGFLALEHISYPTMVLGKVSYKETYSGHCNSCQSCKLIPVLLLNVLIYRRRFSAHKYVVVGLVTIGISLFMLLGDKKKKGGSDSLWGLSLLVIK